MSKLKPEKPRDVIRKLKKVGFQGPYGGGRHVVMRHPQSTLKIPIPIHGNHDIPTGTLQSIIRIAGLDLET